ncbi:hypothetical protein AB5N19_02463 [Seiridium cardinale]
MQDRTSTSSATVRDSYFKPFSYAHTPLQAADMDLSQQAFATDSTTNLPTFVMTTSPISPSDGQEQDCYFTAKAVPIRASIAGPAALSSLNSLSPSPFSPDSPHHSTLITPSQFPPPPGHSYPSFVFRKPPTPLVAEIVDSRASSQYASPASTGVEGRESVLSATPSLFPQPPSANGKEAHIRPLFSRGRQSTLSAMSLPGPTPPPKEYRPTISPMTNDYFSPLAPASTSVQPPPAPPVPPREPQAAAAEFGISRITKPLPLELVGSNTALMAQHSPISPHSPVPNPAMTPLTIQTLTHLSNTALRSPSLTFVEAGLSSPRPSYAGSASPLTSAQRDRLWEMKKKYDERKGRQYDDGDEKGRWGMMRTGGRRGEEGGRGSMRTYLLVGLALGILALGGIVGLVVALALAQGRGS